MFNVLSATHISNPINIFLNGWMFRWVNKWELSPTWHGILCIEDEVGQETGREGRWWRFWNTIGISSCSVGDDDSIWAGMGHNKPDDSADHCEGYMEGESCEGMVPTGWWTCRNYESTLFYSTYYFLTFAYLCIYGLPTSAYPSMRAEIAFVSSNAVAPATTTTSKRQDLDSCLLTKYMDDS